jgi:hypothetical protein
VGKLLIFLIVAFPIQQSTVSALYGKWRLVNVKTSDTILYPKCGEFTIEISENMVAILIEHNWCAMPTIEITNDSIEIDTGGKTKIAEHDPISRILNYSGKYQIQDSILSISNQQGVFTLLKSKK